MKNITVSVRDDIYRAARIQAAERASSVSALVTDYLRSLSEDGAAFLRLEAQQQVQDEIGHWDAAILEAGKALGCDVVLSEDLADGADYGGVRVENPF
jgi:hypothetical protein